MSDPTQFTGMRIDDEPMHLDIVRNQRVVNNGIHRLTDRFFRIAEAIKPFFEIHPTIAYHVNGFLMNATRFHVFYHLFGAHVATYGTVLCECLT